MRDAFNVLESVSGRRRETLAALINLIAARGPTSRAAAMAELGWSRALVTRVATELLDAGVLTETEPEATGRRGRPIALLGLVVDSTVAVGIDLGYRSVRTIVARADHTILASGEETLSDDYGPAEALDAARRMLDAALAAGEVPWDDVVGAGIAISGPIDYQHNAPSLKSLLPHWEGDVLGRAREYLPCPLTLGNDTRLACYAELLWGSGRRYDDFLYLKAHSGVGGAYVLERRIVSGAAGAAGEFGHMVVDPDGESCRCGGRGCLETVVGVPALIRRLGRTGSESAWRDVLRDLERGDARTTAAFAEAFEVIGLAVASLCNILNPQAVILGGALSRADATIRDAVAGRIASSALPMCARTPVEIGELGRNAAALGAVGAVLMRGIV